MYRELPSTGPNSNLHVKMMHNGVSGRMIANLYCDFSFLNHDSNDVQARPVAEWSSTERRDFQTQFVQVCRDAWSFKWQLAGHRDGSAFRVIGLGEGPSNVRMSVEIKPVDTTVHRAPAGANVARVAVFRRNPLVAAGRANAPPGRNGIAVYVSSLDESPDVSGLHTQRVAAHEFGHLLGFEHIRAGASSNQADDSTYGAAGSTEANDIMGRGMVVSSDRYTMFRQIATHFDDRYRWTVEAVSSTSSRTAAGSTGLSRSPAARAPGSVGRST